MSVNNKIIIAADIFPPDIGGPATYSQRIATELVKRGWDVKLICYSNEKHQDKFNFPVYRIIRNRFKPLHYFHYYKTLKKLAKDVDVIYAMGPVASGMPALKVAKKLNKKLAVKVVGDYAWEQARNSQVTDLGIDDFQNKEFGGKTQKLKDIESKVCQGADRVVTPSAYLKSIISGWGVSDDSIEVIYNAFEKTEVNTHDKRDNNLIVSVGRLVPWKGFDVLIELMPELLQVNPDFKLQIFGDGPDKEKLLKLIEKNNLKEKVFINLLPHNQLLEELSGAGMFVLNTGYEGLPHVVLEAMAMGVPVAISNVCGNPEVVQNDFNGLLFEYNSQDEIKSAIEKLSQKDVREKIVANAEKELEKFNFTNMINNTEDTLKNL